MPCKPCSSATKQHLANQLRRLAAARHRPVTECATLHARAVERTHGTVHERLASPATPVVIQPWGRSIFVAYLRKSRSKEAWLVEQFGPNYVRYHQVAKALISFVI